MRLTYGSLCASSVAIVLCLAPTVDAQASVSAEISEVVSGFYAAPTAQYVVLRVTGDGDMTCGNQGYCYTLTGYDNSYPAPVATSTTTVLQYGYSPGTASYYDPNGLPRISHVQIGDRILVANQVAAEFLNVTPDFYLVGQPLSVSGTLALFNNAGGVDDEFSCGQVARAGAGDAVNLPTGGTFSHVTVNAFNYSGGILVGMIATRFQYTSSNSPSVNNTGADFYLASTPWPESLVGVTATLTSTCGNDIIEGIEQCDDGQSNGTDGTCSSTCTIVPGPNAICGDGIVETPEQCDDGNLVSGDGCSSTCRWENPKLQPLPVCGNRIVEVGEDCDPPTNNVCDPNCRLMCAPNINGLCSDPTEACVSGTCQAIAGGSECSGANPNGACPGGQSCTNQGCARSATDSAVCGDGVVETGEQCDDGSNNGMSGDECSSTCMYVLANYVPICGNGIVELGEQCDDGNQVTASINGNTVIINRGNDAQGTVLTNNPNASGCSYLCQFETLVFWRCGDGFVNPGEACDNGAANGTPGNLCNAECQWVTPPSNPLPPSTVLGNTTGTTGSTTAGTTTAGTATAGGTSAGTTTTTGGTGSTAGGTGITTGSTTSPHSTPTTTTGGATTGSTTGGVSEQGSIGCAAATPDVVALLGALAALLAALRRPPRPAPVRVNPKGSRR